KIHEDRAIDAALRIGIVDDVAVPSGRKNQNGTRREAQMPPHGQEFLGALDDGNDREARKRAASDALPFTRDEGEKPRGATAPGNRLDRPVVFRRETAQALQYLLGFWHRHSSKD